MKTINGKERFPVLEIAKINLKHNSLLSVAVSAIFLLLVPVIVGTENLDTNASAVPLEMFVSLIGIVILTPIFQPEQNADIDDLVSSKYVSTIKIYLIRTCYSSIILTVLIGLFAFYMNCCNCEVTLLLLIGTISDAIFLGALGMITSSLCNNTVIAYMIPTVFYALNYGMGSKLGNYYLFSMTIVAFQPKLWLLITGVILIAASILWKGIQRKLK